MSDVSQPLATLTERVRDRVRQRVKLGAACETCGRRASGSRNTAVKELAVSAQITTTTIYNFLKGADLRASTLDRLVAALDARLKP